MYPHRKPLISLFRNNDQTLRNGQSDKAEYARQAIFATQRQFKLTNPSQY